MAALMACKQCVVPSPCDWLVVAATAIWSNSRAHQWWRAYV